MGIVCLRNAGLKGYIQASGISFLLPYMDRNMEGVLVLTMQLENYAEESLTDGARQAAQEFIRYLRANELEFVKDTDYWKDKIYYLIKFRNECVCFIAIKDPDEPENLWTVWSDSSKAYEDSSVEDDIKSAAWKYVDRCSSCGSCGGGKHKTVFGKRFERVCGCTFRVDNPTAADLPFLKKMVELRKNDIISSEKGTSNSLIRREKVCFAHNAGRNVLMIHVFVNTAAV